MIELRRVRVSRPQPIILTPGMAVLTCDTCGFDWETPKRGGRYPATCPECTPDNVIQIRSRARRGNQVPEDFRRLADGKSTKAFLHLLKHCELRLANEAACSLIRLGRYKEALETLETVPARRRVM